MDALTPGSETYMRLLANGAEAGSVAQAQVAAFAQDAPDRVLELGYEALLSSPEAGAAQAFRFLGVGDSREVVREEVKSASFVALSGRERGVEDKGSFFRKGVAGDWVGVLDEQGLAIVENQCAEMMRRSGYARSSPASA